MTRSITRLMLLAGAAGLFFAIQPAGAQDYGRADDMGQQAGPEQIIVQAPYLREERSNVFGHLDKVSMSGAVSYADLDLTTRGGARELRRRVRDTARDICRQLAEDYPFRQQPLSTKCYEGAVKDGLVRADDAIRDARDY